MKLSLAIVFLLGLITSAHGQTARRTMAVTIDDLPYVNISNGVYIKNARAATSKILSTLKKHKVLAVVLGNEHTLETPRTDGTALLREWSIAE